MHSRLRGDRNSLFKPLGIGHSRTAAGLENARASNRERPRKSAQAQAPLGAIYPSFIIGVLPAIACTIYLLQVFTLVDLGSLSGTVSRANCIGLTLFAIMIASSCRWRLGHFYDTHKFDAMARVGLA